MPSSVREKLDAATPAESLAATTCPFATSTWKKPDFGNHDVAIATSKLYTTGCALSHSLLARSTSACVGSVAEEQPSMKSPAAIATNDDLMRFISDRERPHNDNRLHARRRHTVCCAG